MSGKKRWLINNKMMTNKELAEYLGISKDLLFRRIARLRKAGREIDVDGLIEGKIGKFIAPKSTQAPPIGISKGSGRQGNIYHIEGRQLTISQMADESGNSNKLIAWRLRSGVRTLAELYRPPNKEMSHPVQDKKELITDKDDLIFYANAMKDALRNKQLIRERISDFYDYKEAKEWLMSNGDVIRSLNNEAAKNYRHYVSALS